jgi:hypothetical protein
MVIRTELRDFAKTFEVNVRSLIQTFTILFYFIFKLACHINMFYYQYLLSIT